MMCSGAFERSDDPPPAVTGSAVPQAPATAPVDPGAGVDDLKAGLDATRELLRKTGVALGATATAVLTGLGYSQLHELFPIPEGDDWLWAVALGAAAAAVVGAAVLAGRFFGAQRRILLSSRLPNGRRQRWRRGLTKRDVTVAAEVFTDHAREEGAAGVHALDLRAARLQHLSRRATNTAERDRFAEEAVRLSGIVRFALMRGVASILEYRAQKAFRGWPTRLALLSTAAGIVVLWGAADYSKGQRDLIELRTKCVAGEAKGATSACDPVVAEEDDTAAEAAREQAAREGAESIAAAARELPEDSRSVVALAEACNTVVQSRLKEAAESVRAATVAACIRRD
jgi:hypothetical protein